jgi:hypothetical protein
VLEEVEVDDKEAPFLFVNGGPSFAVLVDDKFPSLAIFDLCFISFYFDSLALENAVAD